VLPKEILNSDFTVHIFFHVFLHVEISSIILSTLSFSVPSTTIVALPNYQTILKPGKHLSFKVPSMEQLMNLWTHTHTKGEQHGKNPTLWADLEHKKCCT
jgi:hypothetical protein